MIKLPYRVITSPSVLLNLCDGDLIFSRLLGEYLQSIGDDYVGWNQLNAYASREDVIRYFLANFKVERGRSYLKVTTANESQRSVHSFIVLKDTKKFKKGDVLKAATYKAPATNKARMNLFHTPYADWRKVVSWTGVY